MCKTANLFALWNIVGFPCDADDGAADRPVGEIFQVIFENDLFIESDHYYTQGLFIRDQFVGSKSGGQRFSIGMELSQQIYTGCSIETPSASQDTVTCLNHSGPTGEGAYRRDRPWAGLLQFGPFYEWSWDDGDFVHLGVHMGLVGPSSQAQVAQTFWHDLVTSGARTPQGWQDQVKTQRGVVILGEYSPGWLVAPRSSGSHLEVRPVLSGAAGGLLRYAELDLVGRLSYPQTIPKAMLTSPSISLGTTHLNNDFSVPGSSWNLLLYLRGGNRYVDENVTITGDLQITDNDREIRRTVHILDYGGILTWGAFNFEYAVVRQSPEMRNAILNENHRYGRISLTYACMFGAGGCE